MLLTQVVLKIKIKLEKGVMFAVCITPLLADCLLLYASLFEDKSSGTRLIMFIFRRRFYSITNYNIGMRKNYL